MVQLTLNNQLVNANEGDTILEVATANHILIPTLCFLQDVHAIGSCRICSVADTSSASRPMMLARTDSGVACW